MKRPIPTSIVAFVLAASIGCSESMPTQPVLASSDDALYAKQGPTGSRMLFYTGGSVWMMNDDGSAEVRVSDPVDHAFFPSWASDGKRILFAAHRGEENTSIYVMNQDGSAVTRITRAPDGSSDNRPTKFGKGLAFVRYLGGNVHEIYSINIDGTGERRLVSGASVTASPKADRLAYVHDGDIWEYHAATERSINLTNTPTIFEGDPSYSPDGKQIAFVASIGNTMGIYVMRSDGTAVTRIASSVELYAVPKWSPDGKRLAFNRAAFSSYEIWVTNKDKSVTKITDRPDTPILTAWAQ